jgi:hypothetical protein
LDLTTLLLWWLALSFGAGLQAIRKHRRARTWFALGLLLGPLAFLIISIQDTQDPNQAHESDHSN